MGLWYLLLLSALVSGHSTSPEEGAKSRRCKVVLGDANWPPKPAWDHLNSTLGGRLLSPTPPGAVCHADWPTYDAERCKVANSSWTLYAFHDASPVSTLWNQFNNDSCLPDPGLLCSGAGYPAYVIRATTADHVKNGVDFARKHDVRLVIRGTGSDYIGRSNAPGALSILTHGLKGYQFYPASFKPQGCNFDITGPSAIVGAGSQMRELYEALDKDGQAMIGGGGEYVGMGGYITGGGHGVLSPRYGLAADRVLEVEMVTPNGDIIVANECQNKDLFWAVRGGGGSTFGVLTSIVIQTFPSPPMLACKIIFGFAGGTTTVFDLVAYMASQFPYLHEYRISGYTSMIGNVDAGYLYSVSMILPDSQDPTDADAVWEPILTHVNATWPGALASYDVKPYGSFLSFFNDHHDTNPAGDNHWSGSRLVDPETLRNKVREVRDALQAMAGTDVLQVVLPFLLSGEGVWNAKPRGGGNAVVPAWRKAMAHITTAQFFPPLDPAAKLESIEAMNKKMAKMRELVPGMGAYMNEAHRYEPDWQRTFWGTNYPRLLKIKKHVDAGDVFWCPQCVGSEDWEEVGRRLCIV